MSRERNEQEVKLSSQHFYVRCLSRPIHPSDAIRWGVLSSSQTITIPNVCTSASPMAAGIVYKDARMPSHTSFIVSDNSRSPAGYTIVFKNEVTEETVMKYMDDIVDAGGRLTQSYDSFLNVCATSQPSVSPLPVLICSRMSLQGFCAAIPEPYLKLLNKNTTDIDYIGMCCCLSHPKGVPHCKYSRAGRSSQEGLIGVIRRLCILGCKGKSMAFLGVSWVSVFALCVDHPCL